MRESGTKELTEGSWRSVMQVASRHWTAEVTSWHEIGSRAVREGQSRWVGIPSSFVEISLEIHASVSLHLHKGMQCYITPFLAI